MRFFDRDGRGRGLTRQLAHVLQNLLNKLVVQSKAGFIAQVVDRRFQFFEQSSLFD